MNLELVNNLMNNIKENNFVQNFIKELSDSLEKTNNQLSNDANSLKINNLKQEECLYQVTEMDTGGAYLQNISNNIVSKETDISKETLDKIGNDTVLRYKDGEYVIEEELTEKFFDSLIGIKEYKEIQDNFIKKSNILEIDSNTRYKIKTKDKNESILTYGKNERNTIKVPNALIPFWANIGESLYYKNGKFNREV